MANHKIYQYTALARPLEPSVPAGKAVLYLLPFAALLGLVMGWIGSARRLSLPCQQARERLQTLLVDPNRPRAARYLGA